MSATDRIAAREQDIYERSIAEALPQGVSDWLDDGDGGMWLPCETRGQAIAYYASELGHAFTEVRARREYMRISLDAIRDRAHDIASDDGYEDDDHPIAYTWEGEGWVWERCKRDDDRAMALWYCDLRPPAEAHREAKAPQ